MITVALYCQIMVQLGLKDSSRNFLFLEGNNSGRTLTHTALTPRHTRVRVPNTR